jgi:hypothetical protein
MQHEIHRQIVITLTEEEANWLHARMQNAYLLHESDVERPNDRRIREDLFNATRTAG